jgi:hypothetical protein
MPMTVVDLLHDRVLRFYAEHGIEIEHLVSDGRQVSAARRCSSRTSCTWQSTRSTTCAKLVYVEVVNRPGFSGASVT